MRPSFSPARLFFHRLLWAAVCLAVVAGSKARASESDERAGTIRATYKLRPMDLLKVQVFQETDLDRELRISQDYKIVAPLIGVIDLKGCTVRDAELLMTQLYRKDYLVNPQINITVLEYAPRSVNVLGAVNSPGTVTIPAERELNLLDVIARSGGFSRLANRSRVSLTRSFPDGQTITYTIDAEKLVGGGDANRGPIQDGDVIYVPERVL